MLRCIAKQAVKVLLLKELCQRRNDEEEGACEKSVRSEEDAVWVCWRGTLCVGAPILTNLRKLRASTHACNRQ